MTRRGLIGAIVNSRPSHFDRSGTGLLQGELQDLLLAVADDGHGHLVAPSQLDHDMQPTGRPKTQTARSTEESAASIESVEPCDQPIRKRAYAISN